MECNDAEELYPYLPTEGFIAINSDSGAGFYTANGNEAIPVGTFEETRPIHNGLAWVKDKTTGLWGVIEISSDKIKITDSGECGAEGDNVKWELYENGTLRIHGSGDMKNYLLSNVSWEPSPWYEKSSSIKDVIIENGVTSIGDKAFNGCSLTEITIPDSVTSIGEGAFKYCKGLTEITIPNSVTGIVYDMFFQCTGLTSITIPNSVISIGHCVFANCTSLTDITIPNSVTWIGTNVFYGCTSLTKITIPDSVTSIGEGVFEDCTRLTSVTIPYSVTSIGNRAFRYCTNLTDVYYTGTAAALNGRTEFK